MKKSLLIILLLLSFIGLRAQSWVYHPFPTDSAIWTNHNGLWVSATGMPPFTEQVTAPDRYCMSSVDTIINLNTYSKIDYCGGAYKGAFRDDGIGKIYFVPADSLNELLLYDFSVQVGDTANVYEESGSSNNFYPWSYVIGPSSIDSVSINGSYRKRIFMQGAYWIEGIGCTYGLFREAWPNVSGYTVGLDCMSVRDTTLYPSFSVGPCSLTSSIVELNESESFILYPNPTNGLLQIKTEQQLNLIEIMDVFGKQIYHSEKNQTEINISAFTNGIYFVRLSDSKENSIVKKIVKQ